MQSLLPERGSRLDRAEASFAVPVALPSPTSRRNCSSCALVYTFDGVEANVPGNHPSTSRHRTLTTTSLKKSLECPEKVLYILTDSAPRAAKPFQDGRGSERREKGEAKLTFP